MGEQEVKMLKQFAEAVSNGQQNIGGITDNIKLLGQHTASLENGLIEISTALQHVSMEVNLCRLSINMIFNILSDNGILTKEEIQEKYTKEVYEPFKEAQAKLDAKIEEAQRKYEEQYKESELEHQQLIEQAQKIFEAEEIPINNEEGDIQLASEKHEKVKWRNIKDEK